MQRVKRKKVYLQLGMLPFEAMKWEINYACFVFKDLMALLMPYMKSVKSENAASLYAAYEKSE